MKEREYEDHFYNEITHKIERLMQKTWSDEKDINNEDREIL